MSGGKPRLTSYSDHSAKKRGKPEHLGQSSMGNGSEQLRTPVSQSASLPLEPQATPTPASAQKTASNKTVKALPTVRDHTTDTLTPEGDEFVPREYDDQGERKVNGLGKLMDGRQYRMRTFYVPNRGDKLFMLATECARVLSYRDSYLLFNKNRSLFKIIATQAEKDELIHQEILPYSYRSRQIAIVTARSMFRQFGARVIVDGRRVRDDYWENKAKKQGFTEADLAGEKRPGANKVREGDNAQTSKPPPLTGRPGPVVYATMPPLSSHPMPSMPMPQPLNLTEMRDLHTNVPRPKPDMTSPAYIDHTQPSLETDILHQAAAAGEHNRALSQQGNTRRSFYNDAWTRPHESPEQTPRVKTAPSPLLNQSPHMSSHGLMNNNASPMPPQLSHINSPPNYPGSRHSVQQSPVRQPMPSGMPQHTPQSRSVYNPVQSGGHQPSPYGYQPQPQQQQMWGAPPAQPQQRHPQQSPMSPHHPSLTQFTPPQDPSQSPLHQQQHHPSQSSHPQQSPQLQGPGSGIPGGMSYQAMPGMQRGGPGINYGAAAGMGGGRNMWLQPGQSSQQQPGSAGGPGGHAGSPPQQQHQTDYLNQMTAAGQSGATQGWAPPVSQGQGQGQWAGYPVSSGF